MPRPEARIRRVRLDINASTDFTRKFGKQLRAAGGDYDDVRGSTSRRCVHVPWGRRDLIDAIVTQFQNHRKTTIVIEGIDGSYNGATDHRVSRLFGPGHTVLHWSKDLGVSPSDHIDGFFRDSFNKIDWDRITARWDEQDSAEADRKRESSLRQRLDDIKVRIAAESLRILDGANDIDGLKELAQDFRDTCAALGIDEPRSEFSDTSRLGY